jgi:hypothetical protein
VQSLHELGVVELHAVRGLVLDAVPQRLEVLGQRHRLAVRALAQRHGLAVVAVLHLHRPVTLRSSSATWPR